MAITKTTSFTDVQTGTSLFNSFPVSAAVGTTIVVGINRTGGTVSSLADDKGNVYTLIGTPLTQTGANIWLYYAKVVTGGTVTITATLSATGTESVGVVSVFSGLDTSLPLDQFASAIGSGTTPTAGPTGTTIQADELVICFIGVGVSTFPTAGTGYTLSDFDGLTILGAVEYKVTSAEGAQTASFTVPSSTWSAIVATFRGPRLTQPGNYGHYARVGNGMSRSEAAN